MPPDALTGAPDRHDPPRMYVPPDASADLARVARGLSEVFGFASAENVAPVLAAGRPVLLLGWRDFYCQAIGRFPGGCRIYWSHGWSASEARGEGHLATVLGHGPQAPLLWGTVCDVMPLGARRLPPVWRLRQPHVAHDQAPGRHVIVGDLWGMSGPEDAAADGFVPSLAAASVTRAMLHVPAALTRPRVQDLRERVQERAQIAESLLGAREHRRYEAATKPPPGAPIVHLGATEAWPWHLIDAIEGGHPAIVSSAVRWADELPDLVSSECVVAAPWATELAAEMAIALLASPARCKATVRAQGEALGRLRDAHMAEAADSLRALGFNVPRC